MLSQPSARSVPHPIVHEAVFIYRHVFFIHYFHADCWLADGCTHAGLFRRRVFCCVVSLLVLGTAYVALVDQHKSLDVTKVGALNNDRSTSYWMLLLLPACCCLLLANLYAIARVYAITRCMFVYDVYDESRSVWCVCRRHMQALRLGSSSSLTGFTDVAAKVGALSRRTLAGGSSSAS